MAEAASHGVGVIEMKRDQTCEQNMRLRNRLAGSLGLLLLFALAGCGTFDIQIEDGPAAASAEPASQRAVEAEQTTAVAEKPLPISEATEVPAEEGTTAVAGASLPAPVYFLNADDEQIWRVETDAFTLTQLTTEEAPITDYDVSQKDGSLVYVSDNQLIYSTSALGGMRRVLAPGRQDLSDDDFLGQAAYAISRPRWSPDGDWIIYGQGGIQIYRDPAAPREPGRPEVRSVLDNDPLPDPLPDEDSVFEIEGPQNLYSPLFWMDDVRVLISVDYYFALGGYKAILNVEDGSLVAVEQPDGAPCCTPSWSPWSQTLFYAGSQPGMGHTGLWQLDPESGSETILVPGERAGELQLFAFPLQIDSELVYGFYGTEPVTVNPALIPRRPLRMVVVATDGSAELEFLGETYAVVGEAAWRPDGSGAVIVDVAATKDMSWPVTGLLRWWPSDGGPLLDLPVHGAMPRW